MGLPVEINPLFVSSTSGYQVGRSLRFRSSASAYLSRTPAGAGSQTTWTWSAWVKRGTLGGTIALCQAGSSTANETMIMLDSDSFRLYNDAASSTNMNLVSTAVYRDPSAWYHFVVAYNSTQATSTNRVSMYVNGVQITSFSTSTYPAQNQTTVWNSAVAHAIGERRPSADLIFDGYLAEVNFIDGTALTPSSFGAYDTNGVWQPKKYTGTYGTNGFYLPFSAGFNTTQSYAGSFNGSSQFLNVAASASLAPGTGDFTVEANVNFSGTPSSGGFYGVFENQIATTAATSDKFWFGIYNATGTLRLYMGQHNTANSAYVNWTPTLGTWYHLALVRTSGTYKMFINGVEQTITNTISGATSFSQNGASVGAASNTGSPAYLNGFISNARYVVGTAVYTASFTPPSANLTAVTNTQLLTLQNATIVDNSSAARTITNTGSVIVSAQYPFQYTAASVSADYSGNGNNWTPNNINATSLGTTYDSMIDSPTVGPTASNYCVLNPVYSTSGVLSNANLKSSFPGGTTNTGVTSSFVVSSGKWYWEMVITGTLNLDDAAIGVCSPATFTFSTNPNTCASSGYLRPAATSTQRTSVNGTNGATLTSATYASGQVLMVAFDADAKQLWFGAQGTWFSNGGVGNPAAGTFASITGINGTSWMPTMAAIGGTFASQTQEVNYGQRPFSYTPPTGFNALNTYNLPAATITNGAQYMAATLWTGADTGTGRSITNGGNNTLGTTFAPDFWWTKLRAGTGAYSHQLFDSVRGAGSAKALASDATGAEGYGNGATYGYLSSFDSSGVTFTRGSAGSGANPDGYAYYDELSATYVGWSWKAGGTGVTNTSGTITSTVSANPTAGFSIVTYTGTGANATVGHGLGVAPSMIIVKNRTSGVTDWAVYHSNLTSASYYLFLNSTQAQAASAIVWNNTAPTSSVFSIGTGSQTNGSTNAMVAYCFAAVSGYSAFGSYTGNGSTDGPFVYLGFRPRYVLIKDTAGIADWNINDSSRDTYNQMAATLFADASSAESSQTALDFLSNGFKIRGSTGQKNSNGTTYIYAAFAENPFTISRAR